MTLRLPLLGRILMWLLLNLVLLLAIKDHASDIHFEPFEDEFKIR